MLRPDVKYFTITMSIAGVSGEHLRQIIEKVERLEQDKIEIMEAIREVFAEAKGEGFDVRIMKQILKIRRMKKEDVVEQEELLDLYKQALGML